VNAANFQHTYDVLRYFVTVDGRYGRARTDYSPGTRSLPAVDFREGRWAIVENLRLKPNAMTNKSSLAPQLEALAALPRSSDIGLVVCTTFDRKYLAGFRRSAESFARYPLTGTKRRRTETGVMNTPKRRIVMAYRPSLAYSHHVGALQHECARVAS